MDLKSPWKIRLRATCLRLVYVSQVHDDIAQTRNNLNEDTRDVAHTIVSYIYIHNIAYTYSYKYICIQIYRIYRYTYTVIPRDRYVYTEIVQRKFRNYTVLYRAAAAADEPTTIALFGFVYGAYALHTVSLCRAILKSGRTRVVLRRSVLSARGVCVTFTASRDSPVDSPPSDARRPVFRQHVLSRRERTNCPCRAVLPYCVVEPTEWAVTARTDSA